MNIDIDDTTKARLLALAAQEKTSPEQLGANWLRHAAKYHAERAEDMQRLDGVRQNGGIPHDEMMDWLRDLAAGKNA